MREYQKYLCRLTVDSIQRTLKSVATTDLKTAQIDDLKVKLSGLLWAYSCFAVQIDRGRSIYRARKHGDDERDRPLDHVTQIYPDAKYIKTLGRANREGEPIFYFSADPVIALNECKAQTGDIFSVLECKARGETEPVLVPIGIHDLVKKHNKRMGGDYPELPVRIKALFERDDANLHKYLMIDDFIKTEFLKVVGLGNEYQFKTTIAISEYLFSFETDLGFVDGIAYPSIASDWYNANVAFKPEAFRRLYRPVGCKWQRIDGMRPNFGFEISEGVAIKVTENGAIEW